MPNVKRTVLVLPVKVRESSAMVTAYIAHCGDNNKGYTIEILEGTHQEIVDAIRDRRHSHGHVDIVNMDSEGGITNAIITYIIK